jgi:hypothetical protein
MKSSLVKFAGTVSWLLLVGTLALWVRGYWVRDGIWYSTERARYSVHSYRGRVWVWGLSGGRSASDTVWIARAGPRRGFVVDSTPDSYLYAFLKAPKGVGPDGGRYALEAPASGMGPVENWQGLGFRYLRNNAWLPIAQLQWGYPTARSTAVYVPHWAVAVVFGVLPVAGLVRVWRRRRRLRRGLCVSCGYDLRGNSGRCPECGASPSHRAGHQHGLEARAT